MGSPHILYWCTTEPYTSRAHFDFVHFGGVGDKQSQVEYTQVQGNLRIVPGVGVPLPQVRLSLTIREVATSSGSVPIFKQAV